MTLPGNEPCCTMHMDFVVFRSFFDQTLNITVSTVVTQYLQYNNTIVTNYTTIPNTAINTTELYRFTNGKIPVSFNMTTTDIYGAYAGYSLGPVGASYAFNGNTMYDNYSPFVPSLSIALIDTST